MTQFGPEHIERLDRFYCDAHLLPAGLVQVSTMVVPGFRKLSDHIPVCIHISAKKHNKSNRIPMYVIGNEAFAHKVRELWAACAGDKQSCWEQLRTLKADMQRACKHVKSSKNSHETIEYELGVASRFFQAVVGSDRKQIEQCICKCRSCNIASDRVVNKRC